MAAKRTCGRYVTPFNCISGGFVSVVPVILFRLFWWFRFGCFGGSVPAVPVVPVVSFRRFRFGVSGFSTCRLNCPCDSIFHVDCKYLNFHSQLNLTALGIK